MFETEEQYEVSWLRDQKLYNNNEIEIKELYKYIDVSEDIRHRTSNELMYQYFLEALKLSPTKRFIETGTYFGDLSVDIYKYCDEILTCECDELSSAISKKQIENYKDKIKFYPECDTRDFFKIIKLYDTDVIFLDAHSGDQPILNELQLIYEQKVKPTIFIHDFGEVLDETLIEKVIEIDEYYEESIIYDGKNISAVKCPIDNKHYRYRFEYDIGSGFVLNWETIEEKVKQIYGDNFSTYYGETTTNVGWIRIIANDF